MGERYLGWGLPSVPSECEVCAALASGVSPEAWREGRAARAEALWAEVEASRVVGWLEDACGGEDDLTRAMLLGEISIVDETASTLAQEEAIELLEGFFASRRLTGELSRRSGVVPEVTRSAQREQAVVDLRVV